MSRTTRQLSSFELAVRELIPGREYPLDSLMTLCRAKDSRFGFSTLQSYLRAAVDAGVLIRVGRGVYASPNSQGAVRPHLTGMVPQDPLADVSARLLIIEDGVRGLSKQMALLGQALDHNTALLRTATGRGV